MRGDKVKYIIDTDPGIDDAVAIMMGYLNGLDIIGFTLAQGNVDLTNSENNIKIIEDILGSDIKIYKSNIIKEIDYEAASYAHGKNGMGDVITMRSARRTEGKSAEDFIIESSLKYRNNLTLICFGPLTNLANAIKKDPSLVDRISKVVIMGFSYDVNANSPYHEFNLSVDPEAAFVVINSGFKDVNIITHEVGILAFIEKDYIDMLANSHSMISRFISSITKAYMQFSKKYFNVDGFTAPDPITCASVINKKCVSFMPCEIDIDLKDRGVSIVRLVESSNIKISTGVNLNEFRELFQKTFK